MQEITGAARYSRRGPHASGQWAVGSSGDEGVLGGEERWIMFGYNIQ